jgi:DNA repair exonuclease SbcCD nuclease subunit
MINKSKVAVFSDLHLGVHSNSTQWHEIALNWCRWFVEDLKRNNIKDVIFCGDWYHNRSEISVDTLTVSAEIFELLSDFNLTIITGNHDMYFKHRTDVHSLNIVKGRVNVNIIDKPFAIEKFDRTITFLPWGFDTSTLPDGDICFGHLEIESFKMNSAKTCEDGIKASTLLRKFDLVVSGHFHTRHERTFEAGTILYVGNPFEMDFGDSDNEKGYYILDLDDLSYNFIPNNISPKYKKISLSEMVAQGTITNEMVQIFNNNFVKLKIDRNISQDDLIILNNVLSKLKSHSITQDYDLNYNKILTDNNTYDFSGIDIGNAIEEFINLLDIDNKDSIVQYTLNLFNKCKNA